MWCTLPREIVLENPPPFPVVKYKWKIQKFLIKKVKTDIIINQPET